MSKMAQRERVRETEREREIKRVRERGQVYLDNPFAYSEIFTL